MTFGRSRRWPLHPPPAPGEALSSWLARLAAPYDLSVRQLLDHNLGPASALAATVADDAVDWDPPPQVLDAMAERTGTQTAELRLMTIAGWVPWLADTLDPDQGPEVFPTYTRQDSVLLRRGETGTNTVGRWLPWLPVDREPHRAPPRVCPECATDPDRGVALTAGLLLMLSCPDHGCLLEPEGTVRIGHLLGVPTPARPAPEPVAAVDRLTWEALTTGTVTLPARPVHLGVWLRLLRTLIDEVSISTSRLRAASARMLDQIWEASGYPPRGGITVWRPYEQLRDHQQDAVLTAAATALHLAKTGVITPRGTFGPLLTVQPHQPVYDGDRPDAAELARRARHQAMREDWEKARLEIEAWFEAARTDPATALQILKTYAGLCRTREAYDRERDFMIGQGIPVSFLPDPEPGRFAPAAVPLGS